MPLDRPAVSATALAAADELAERLGADIHALSVVARDDQVRQREAQLAALEISGRSVASRWW